MAAATPRDVSTYSTLQAAEQQYQKARASRLNSGRYKLITEFDDNSLKMCAMRDIDGYKTTITLIATNIE